MVADQQKPKPEGSDSGGAAGSAAGGDGQRGGGAASGQGQALNFDAWYGQQPEEVQHLLDGHERGLKSALESERRERKEMAEQLRDAATRADGALKEELGQLSGKLEAQEERTVFYEAAAQAGITNLKLAYLAAKELGCFDRKGNPDLPQLLEAMPELRTGGTAPRQPTAHAGAGANSGPPAAMDMNTWIRRQAGR